MACACVFGARLTTHMRSQTHSLYFVCVRLRACGCCNKQQAPASQGPPPSPQPPQNKAQTAVTARGREGSYAITRRV